MFVQNVISVSIFVGNRIVLFTASADNHGTKEIVLCDPWPITCNACGITKNVWA